MEGEHEPSEYAPFDLIPTDLMIYLATFIACKDLAKFAKLSRKHAHAVRYATTMHPRRLIGATVYYCAHGYFDIMAACVQKAGARMDSVWCDAHLLKCQHDLMIAWMMDYHRFTSDALNSRINTLNRYSPIILKIIDTTDLNYLVVLQIVMHNYLPTARAVIAKDKITLNNHVIYILLTMVILQDYRESLQALLEDPRVIAYLRLQYLPDWMPRSNVSARCRRMIMDAIKA